MKSLLGNAHVMGLVIGVFLTIDALANLQTDGHRVVLELGIALVAMVVSFTAYTIKHRI